MSDIPTLHPTKSLDALLKQAARAGMAKVQMERFLSVGYFPLRNQVAFHGAARIADKGTVTRIMQGGGRGGSKSHAMFAQIMLDDCQRLRNGSFLILRKVGKAAKKQVGELRKRLLMHTPHRYSETRGEFYFPEMGSKVTIGHYATQRDLDNILGLEYDGIGVEEATQLNRDTHIKILGQLRTSKPNWVPRLYLATNPGGTGHAYCRATYYLPWKNRQQTNTAYIHSTYKDNPFIDAGYKKYLLELTGTLAAFWRDGNWDAVAGAFFNEFDYDRHVMRIAPGDVPADAPMVLSYDHGFAHYAVAGLHTKIDGNKYTIDERWARRWFVSDLAEMMNEMLGEWDRPIETLSGVVAGHDIFARRGGERNQMSIAMQFAAQGLPFARANIDRLAGAGLMLTMLGNQERGREPTWFIGDRCAGLIATLPLLESDPNRPDDVKKWDAKTTSEEDDAGLVESEFDGDDFYDQSRYGLMTIAADELAAFLVGGKRRRRGKRPPRVAPRL